jgi:hypothetical protein
MKTRSVRIAFLAVACCSLWAFAVPRLLAMDVVGYVFDSESKPIAGVKITILALGSDTSTASGEFHITVPSCMVGKRITLQVYKDGWTVPSAQPLAALVPANGVTDPIVLHLVKAGKSLASVSSPSLIADFSVLPGKDGDDLGLFDIAYSADKNGAGIHVSPKVPYLELLRSGGPIGPEHYWWTPFEITLPELDIKLVNNSSKTVFLTEADFIVDQSKLDPSPVLLIPGEGYFMSMNIINFGWGKVKNPEFRFNLIPLPPKDASINQEKLFADAAGKLTQSLPVQEQDDGIEFDFAPVLASLGVDVETLRNRPVERVYGSDGHQTYTFQPKNGPRYTLDGKQYRDRLERANGKFLGGSAFLFGEISYDSPDVPTKRSSTKLVNIIHFGEPGVGAPRPPSFTYSVKFEVNGEKYVKKVALSQVLMPQEADRFTIKIAADSSSHHLFRLRLIYNDGKSIESPNMSLDLFMPRDAGQYLTKEEGEDLTARRSRD